MTTTRALAAGLVAGVLSTTGCTLALPSGGETANGVNAQLSFDVDGAVAAGSPFKIKVWAPTQSTRCYGLLGCSDRAPMTGAALDCADPSVCEKTDKEPNESENYECTFIMKAHGAGTTEIVAKVITADGELREDRIPIKIVDATDVVLTCETCEAGRVPSDRDTDVTCHPLNPSVQELPLRGDCEVTTDGVGLDVRPTGADADFNITTERGTAANNFAVRVTDSRAGGSVVFRSGGIERRMQPQGGTPYVRR